MRIPRTLKKYDYFHNQDVEDAVRDWDLYRHPLPVDPSYVLLRLIRGTTNRILRKQQDAETLNHCEQIAQTLILEMGARPSCLFVESTAFGIKQTSALETCLHATLWPSDVCFSFAFLKLMIESSVARHFSAVLMHDLIIAAASHGGIHLDILENLLSHHKKHMLWKWIQMKECLLLPSAGPFREDVLACISRIV